ncbi:trypsin-like peptidase domain-containing protein [Parasegetibacter sp. NRK P23]|uniref:trypsin-like peptidase domain-containing protein n=1 Tax=Parasegetibacter sp. NRK P23 TaxID=2942999 RepID=UPI002043368E|nr:trypsin-like peptidase domain-containing protein [Parasegetibacter sp. NRK P23]MCM5529211.1 trypsin-like peptidase domain-containing protein [Parasegetibacter sp. NRK P23]
MNQPFRPMAILLKTKRTHSLQWLCFLCFALISFQPLFAQQFRPAAFEEEVIAVVKKVSSAAVRISGYDSVRNVPAGGKFSGVVVSADGLVLTAAHASRPNAKYKLFFPDGKEAIGVGLGRIGTVDAALIKIIDAGTWPYAEMGWSYGLKEYQPCLSIAYPASIETNKAPVVRLGYVAEPVSRSGMIRSTCLMEPGDSGGPLFDMFGRVIGIHSRIDVALDVNLEIPVDHFRKYWTALHAPENYRGRELPAEDNVGIDPLEGKQKVHPQLAALTGLFNEGKQATVSVTNGAEGAPVAWGTVVALKGAKEKYIVSKSSLVGNDPFVQTGARSSKATVVRRHDSLDLVLLKADVPVNAVELSSGYGDTLRADVVGSFLVSVAPSGNKRVGVFSAAPVAVPGRSGIGFLGVMSEQLNGKLSLREVVQRSPAELSRLQKGDLLHTVNGTDVSSPEELSKALERFKPGDSVELKVNRNDSAFAVFVKLGARPEIERHAADRLEEGKSVRKDGFARVFVHDTPVRPEECGGPVYNRNGAFQGVNIARISRTSTLAVPYKVLYDFVRGSTAGE